MGGDVGKVVAWETLGCGDRRRGRRPPVSRYPRVARWPQPRGDWIPSPGVASFWQPLNIKCHRRLARQCFGFAVAKTHWQASCQWHPAYNHLPNRRLHPLARDDRNEGRNIRHATA